MLNGTDLSLKRSGGHLRRFAPGRDSMVLVLTWAASGVDAISYLGLGHVFTANMTGNAVLLGLAIGQGQGLAALRSIIALAGFVIGVAVSAVVLETSTHRGEWPVSVTRGVLAEAIILGVFTATWHLGTHSGGLLYAPDSEWQRSVFPWQRLIRQLDDQFCSSEIGVIPCAHLDRGGQHGAVLHVRHHALRAFSISVHQHHLARAAAHYKRKHAR